MFNDAIERFINETTSWPGQSHYRDRLNQFHATIFQKCRSVYNCNKLGYNVLNHGDFHFKNTMYKFNGDNLEDVLFVSSELLLLLIQKLICKYSIIHFIGRLSIECVGHTSIGSNLPTICRCIHRDAWKISWWINISLSPRIYGHIESIGHTYNHTGRNIQIIWV